MKPIGVGYLDGVVLVDKTLLLGFEVGLRLVVPPIPHPSFVIVQPPVIIEPMRNFVPNNIPEGSIMQCPEFLDTIANSNLTLETSC